MRNFVKWLLWSGLCVLFVSAFVGAGILYIFKNSVAPNNGSFALSGLVKTVNVVKDKHNIPHIKANSREDAIRTLGYLHASERLWQMEVLRMAGQGRLSELFGKPTVSSDIFLRTVDFVTPSRNSVDVLGEEATKLLQAYSDGVNAYIEREVSGFTPQFPPEFLIVGHNPEKWEIWHSLVIVKVMAMTLDHNMDKEIGRLAMASKGFSPNEVDQIYLYNSRDKVVSLPDLRRIYGYSEVGKESAQTVKPERVNDGSALIDHAVLSAWDINQTASNSWAISGTRTESGKPLMANDPHLALTTPSVFYLAHMSFNEDEGPFNIIGGSLPGTPLFLVGRNDFVSWGLTTTKLDSQDLFIEKLNPQNSNMYQSAIGYRIFDKEQIEIKIKGEPSVSFERRVSHHGPVLPRTYKNLEKRLPNGTVAALRWTALDDDDTTVEGALDLSMSRDVTDIFISSQKLVSPMQSIISADVKGNIGLIAAGRVPVRDPENKIKGRAPVPGWQSKYDWKGYLPFADLPKIVNPKIGALVTANSNWLPANYPHHITYDWSEDFRQQRAETLYLNSNVKHDAKSVAAGMGDNFSPALVSFRDVALEDFASGTFFHEIILINLRNWNGFMDVDAAEPLILTAWVKHVNRLLFEDDFGDDFSLLKGGSVERVIDVLVKSNERNWCNKRQTAKLETCGQILAEGLHLAVQELEKSYGSNIEKWRWGTAHKSLHEHRPFSKVSQLSDFFTTRPEIAGGRYTLLRSMHKFTNKEPYAAVAGAAYRGLYDFTDLNKSGYVNSSGQSGNVMSEHYDDLSKKWADIELLQMSTNPSDYSQNQLGVLEFTPQ